MSTNVEGGPRRVAPDDWVIQHVAALAGVALELLIRTRLAQTVRRSWVTLRREGFFRITGIATTAIVLGAVAVFFVEQDGEEPLITSLWEALWYSLVTVATVGYGDYTPKTVLGRVIGSVLILVGVAVFSLASATIASIFVAQRIREGRGLEAVKFKGHILVCGWNAHAERILQGIALAQGNERTQVVLINELPEDVATEVMLRLNALDLRYVRGDPASEAV
ncbi:MAG: two pore domain potassium channel family protein, partial [Betaproteobacteria bacterium]|nr:two pore domain potassium channel family protein [Betaproteobacteria bacterium]